MLNAVFVICVLWPLCVSLWFNYRAIKVVKSLQLASDVLLADIDKKNSVIKHLYHSKAKFITQQKDNYE